MILNLYDVKNEYATILATVRNTEHGEQRVKLLEECISLADKEKDAKRQLKYRLLANEETVFYSDSFKEYIYYPMILKISDEYYESTGERPFLYDILWDYKWLFSSMEMFYQIDDKQVQDLAADAIERYKNNGYSLRSLYQALYYHYKDVDTEKTDMYYELYRKEKRDSMSDCMACERSSDVGYLLARGRFDEAVNMADAVFRGKTTCAEQPYSVQLKFMEYSSTNKLLKKIYHKVDDLSDMAASVRNGITKKGVCTEDIGNMLIYYALFEPNKALPWLKLYPDFADKTYEPRSEFDFALGMMLFLKNLGDKKTYRMKMDKRFRFYNENNSYNVEEMYNYYSGVARDLADKFYVSQGRKICRELYDAAEKR